MTLDTTLQPPLFLDEDLAAAERKFAAAAARQDNVFLFNLTCDDTASAELEDIASLFLLTNVLLMSRSRRSILKLFQVDFSGQTPLPAIVNALRGLLTGEFSALKNVETWIQSVGKRCDISREALDGVRRGVTFLETYMSPSDQAPTEYADVFINVRASQEGIEEGCFTIAAPAYSVLEVRSKSATVACAWNALSRADSAAVRQAPDLRFVQIDCDHCAGDAMFRDWSALTRVLVDHQGAPLW